jgi:hypothetical protein
MIAYCSRACIKYNNIKLTNLKVSYNIGNTNCRRWDANTSNLIDRQKIHIPLIINELVQKNIYGIHLLHLSVFSSIHQSIHSFLPSFFSFLYFFFFFFFAFLIPFFILSFIPHSFCLFFIAFRFVSLNVFGLISLFSL